MRCDRDDVLLTANCDLEPQRLSVTDFARMIAAAGVARPGATGHVPAVTVLTTAGAIERIEAAGLLADALFRIQAELRGRGAVGLRVGACSEVRLTGLAVRASALEHLAGGLLPQPETVVEVDVEGDPADLEPDIAARPAALIGAAARGAGWPLSDQSNPSFLEYMHIEEGRTLFPSSGAAQPRPKLKAVAV